MLIFFKIHDLYPILKKCYFTIFFFLHLVRVGAHNCLACSVVFAFIIVTFPNYFIRKYSIQLYKFMNVVGSISAKLKQSTHIICTHNCFFQY